MSSTNVHDARAAFPGVEQLGATEPDVLLLTAAVSQRGDPRKGAAFDELCEAVERWYDHRDISPRSIHDVLVELVTEDYLRVDDGRHYIKTDALEQLEAHLLRVGDRWGHTHPWEDGMKVVVRQEQVANVTGQESRRAHREVPRDE